MDILEPFKTSVEVLPILTEKALLISLLLVVGYILGRIISKLVEIVLKKVLDIDKTIEDLNLSNALYGKKFSEVCASLVKWGIYFFFIYTAIYLAEVSLFKKPIGVASSFSTFVTTLYLAIFVFLFGLFVAEYLKNFIKQTNISYKNAIANAVKYITIYVFFVTAISQFNINVSIFYDLLRYFAISVAIAFGMAFGIYLFTKHKKDIEEIFKEI